MRLDNRRIIQAIAGLLGMIAIRQAVRRSRRMDFNNKVVLITGGSRGLGLVLARDFIREGARVAICARDVDELERARQQLSPEGQVLAVQCDITDPDDVHRMVQTVWGPE